MTITYRSIATPRRSEIALYILLALLLATVLLPRVAPRLPTSAVPGIIPTYDAACGGVPLPC